MSLVDHEKGFGAIKSYWNRGLKWNWRCVEDKRVVLQFLRLKIELGSCVEGGLGREKF